MSPEHGAEYPEVLVGGFPNSGTSFLCNLVVALGKRPGSDECLKAADAHNRLGYFEHLPLRKLVWKAAGVGRLPRHEEGLPRLPFRFNRWIDHWRIRRIRAMARRDRIEVYKDNYLPLLFRLFPPGSRYLVIRRAPEAVYESPRKAGGTGYACTQEELRAGIAAFRELEEAMAREVGCLILEYEGFHDDFEAAVERVANHLGVTLTPAMLEKARAVFRPRAS